MRSVAIPALLSVVLATPCLARISDGDSRPPPKPALTVVDGSDASIPVGSTVLEGIETGDAANEGDTRVDGGRLILATRASAPLAPIAVLK